ncbi:MAG: DUF4864 domain-containing protein [Myxococcota bacterium]
MSWKSMMMATAVAYADPSLDPSQSDQLEVTPFDASAIQNLIQAQISAFKRDDAVSAYALTSPSIRETFRTPKDFLSMVRRSYPSIYRPKAYELGSYMVTPSGLGQLIDVLGPEEELVTALYLLEKQRDGTWRSHGCVILEVTTLADVM